MIKMKVNDSQSFSKVIPLARIYVLAPNNNSEISPTIYATTFTSFFNMFVISIALPFLLLVSLRFLLAKMFFGHVSCCYGFIATCIIMLLWFCCGIYHHVVMICCNMTMVLVINDNLLIKDSG
jgi:hypothetical protein